MPTLPALFHIPVPGMFTLPVKVGLAESTTLPEPVEEVTPVPPRATVSVPVVSNMFLVAISAKLEVVLLICAQV